MTGQRCQIGNGFDDVRLSLSIHSYESRDTRAELHIHLGVGTKVRQAQGLYPHGQPVRRTGINRYRYSLRTSSSTMPESTAGRVDWVKANCAFGESIAVRPSSRYPGLKAISMSSPVICASRASSAWASSPVPARKPTSLWAKVNRTGVFRSATRATRLTASTSAAVSTTAWVDDSFGNSERYFGNSPSSRREVVRRRSPSKPISRSPSGASATVTESADPKDFAASANVFAGINNSACAEDDAGVQVNSRTASRYRSVAASTNEFPSISILMPVKVGNVSSRPAAIATWATAVAKSEPSKVPLLCGISGIA